MVRLVGKLYPEADDLMQWNKQSGNIKTNLNFKIYYTLTALSATNDVSWNCHVDDSAKGRYDMIVGQDLLTQLGLNPKFSEHFIEIYDGPFNRSTAPMVDLGTVRIYLKI